MKDPTLKQSMRESWQQFVDSGIWQGEDEYTKNMAVGNVADWFLDKFDHIIEEKIQRLEKEKKAFKTPLTPEQATDDSEVNYVKSHSLTDGYNQALDKAIIILKE